MHVHMYIYTGEGVYAYRYKQDGEKGGATGFSMHGENYIETHWEKHVCHLYKTARRMYVFANGRV